MFEAHEFVTVAEAARRLHVSHPTVWRWIKAGRLPAYRVGPKTIRIKAADLSTVVQPATAPESGARRVTHTMPVYTRIDDIPPLSAADREYVLRILKEIDALHETIVAEHGGVPFSSSVDLIHEMREERSRELDRL